MNESSRPDNEQAADFLVAADSRATTDEVPIAERRAEEVVTVAYRRSAARQEDGALPRIRGYEVERFLGHGGMGVVYRAQQQGLNRRVALKMIRAGIHSGPQALARFRAEAESVARLVYPHIVQIHEIGEHDGCPYFSLEYVAGGSLAAKLAGVPQSAQAAAALVETLARTVHYAHQQGIVHRDLKPDNVLLQPAEEGSAGAFGSPKIADFGLAKQLDSDCGQTQSGAILGTPSYMAPEPAEGRTDAVGPPADVYALGAILYEMLTGRPPFRGVSLMDTLEQVRAREPVPPTRLQPSVPRDLETITLKCLRKSPAARYETARELAEDLHRFRAGEPIHARPVSRQERLWRRCRRNPVLTGLLLLAVVSLAVAIVAPTLMAFRLNAALAASDHDRKAKETALTDTFMSLGLMANDQMEPAQAVLWFAHAARLAQNDPERRSLNRLRVRAWDLAAYAASSFAPGRPLLAAARELTERIHADFRYDSKATTVHTPLHEVFRLRRGVCQDFAHLQIGCLRSLGLSARYVSGYLRTHTPPGQQRLRGTDASHAWLSVYWLDFGWIDLDPTNNLIPSDTHILLAWGRDYDDVSPIKGVNLGGGSHTVQVAVDVVHCDGGEAAF